jgi:hypothetical protein
MAPKKRSKPRAYWQLPDFDSPTRQELHQGLSHHGREISKSSNKTQLVYQHERLARSLPSYAKCTTPMLLGFARDRALVSSTGYTPSRWELVDLLLSADEDTRFERFIELPPELRGRIYEYYVDGFSDVVCSLRPPPLALTSKLLKKEVMPVFYARSVFRLYYWQHYRSDQWFPARYNPTPRTWRFVKHLDDNIAGQICNVRIHLLFSNSELHGVSDRLDASFTVYVRENRDTKKPEYRIAFDTVPGFSNELRGSLWTGLSKLFSELNPSKQTKGFTMEDIEALKSVLYDTMPATRG